MNIPLGRTVATPAALEALAATGTNVIALLDRHASGDWGDLGAEDRRLNDRAVKDGSRLLSAYRLSPVPVSLIGTPRQRLAKKVRGKRS